MDVLYIVVPAYNESDNVETLVWDWYPVVERHAGGGDSRLLIVDDGSRDDTYEKLQRLSLDRPLMQVLTKPNGGHGPTLIFGYRHAIADGADWIFQTDSDGQTLPSEFDAFWEVREESDAVIGVRSNRKDGFSRKVVERTLCLLLRGFFGVHLRDANAPFRLMRASLVSRYLDRLPEDFNLPNAMLTTYFVHAGDRVTWREVTFRPRQGGKNSINVRRIVQIGWKALGDFSRLRKELNE